MKIIPNDPKIVVRNLQVLSKGTGARYLECIRGSNDELVAKQWRRKIPRETSSITVLIDFEKG